MGHVTIAGIAQKPVHLLLEVRIGAAPVAVVQVTSWDEILGSVRCAKNIAEAQHNSLSLRIIDIDIR